MLTISSLHGPNVMHGFFFGRFGSLLGLKYDMSIHSILEPFKCLVLFLGVVGVHWFVFGLLGGSEGFLEAIVASCLSCAVFFQDVGYKMNSNWLVMNW